MQKKPSVDAYFTEWSTKISPWDQKTEHLSSGLLVQRDAWQWMKNGTSSQKRDGWQPYFTIGWLVMISKIKEFRKLTEKWVSDSGDALELATRGGKSSHIPVLRRIAASLHVGSSRPRLQSSLCHHHWSLLVLNALLQELNILVHVENFLKNLQYTTPVYHTDRPSSSTLPSPGFSGSIFLTMSKISWRTYSKPLQFTTLSVHQKTYKNLLSRTGISSGTLRSVFEYGLPLHFFVPKKSLAPFVRCFVD